MTEHDTPGTAREESLAQAFHEAYERLAPDFGYETRVDSAVPWGEVPQRNKGLMIAVAADILPAVEARVLAQVRAGLDALCDDIPEPDYDEAIGDALAVVDRLEGGIK